MEVAQQLGVVAWGNSEVYVSEMAYRQSLSSPRGAGTWIGRRRTGGSNGIAIKAGSGS